MHGSLLFLGVNLDVLGVGFALNHEGEVFGGLLKLETMRGEGGWILMITS